MSGIRRGWMVSAALVAARAVVGAVVAEGLRIRGDLSRAEPGLSIIFITHNIAAVDYLCDRILVMSRGEIVERGRTGQVIDHPTHSYTRSLIAAAPKIA